MSRYYTFICLFVLVSAVAKISSRSYSGVYGSGQSGGGSGKRPLKSKGLFGFSFGYGFGFGSNPMEQYLTTNLSNFSHWVTTTTTKASIDIDTLSIANFSDVVIRNRFYDLDLSFTDTKLNGFASKVRPSCVRADLEGGKLIVGYSAYNVTLSGNYTGNGTILNGTSFGGAGSWSLGLHLNCILETYFNYGNASHIQLHGTGGDAKYFRFYCDSKQNLEPSHDRYPSSISNGCEYYSRTKMLYGRINGLFNQTRTMMGVDLSGAQSIIETSLVQHLFRYGRGDYAEILRTRIGPLLYQQLAEVVQGKSVFEMLNFDVHQYYQSHTPMLVVAF